MVITNKIILTLLRSK